MVSAAGEPKETEKKLACQDSAVASVCPPAALPGHIKPLLSAKVRAEPHFAAKTEHMLIPISVSSNWEEEMHSFTQTDTRQLMMCQQILLENIFNCCWWTVGVWKAFSHCSLKWRCFWSSFTPELFLFSVSHDVLEFVSQFVFAVEALSLSILKPFSKPKQHYSSTGNCSSTIQNIWYILG